VKRFRLVAIVCALAITACTKQEQNAGGATTTSADVTAAPSASGSSSAEPTAFSERVTEREAFVRATVEERDVKDPRVIAAMRRVPRHAFVLPEMRNSAYTDRPLPIVGGQTISQPYIVAFMTEAGKPTPNAKCLEIGTGSGYQAAVLAEICRTVYSIEYLPEVANFGKKNLRALGYDEKRVHLRTGDGYRGWPDAAPFDVIIVTAAPDHVPQPLLDQLAVGGRLVIPVGGTNEVQVLERWTRERPGNDERSFRRERLMGVRFVPFLGEGAPGSR
jgi:protein-L-isoaspartate(D-aspartate) O-methyltransferase